MITFILIVVGMCAIALACILPSLLRTTTQNQDFNQRNNLNLGILRSQLQELELEKQSNAISDDDFLGAKADLERRAAEEISQDTQTNANAKKQIKLAIVIAISLPLFLIPMYHFLGDAEGIDTALSSNSQINHNIGEEQVLKMVAGLAEKLQKEPNNPEGWYMLARSYNTLKQYNQAANAFAELNKLIPNNADLLSDYADTLAMTQNQSLQGAPEKLIDQALSIDAKNIKALSLSGSAAFERHDYQQAISQWKKILILLPPDNPMAKTSLSNIGEAQGLLGETPKKEITSKSVAAEDATASKVETAKMSATVSGKLMLSPDLKSQVNENDVVFIFARPADGAKIPLAVLRKQVKDLPLNFTLDDSMAVMPNTHLSDFPKLIIGARISKSGNATASTGDFEGFSEPVQIGSKTNSITISTIRK